MRISHDLIVYQVLSDRRSRAVATRLEYDDRSPLEVRMVFHTDRRDAVGWVFPRELLLDGLGGPSGSGEVRIAPGGPGRHHLVSLLLTGEDGVALVEAPAAEVGAFALQTLRLVPRGGPAASALRHAPSPTGGERRSGTVGCAARQARPLGAGPGGGLSR